MTRVLITGASGFIGQHLSLALMKSGWIVRGMGRSARPSTLEGVEWMTGDILDQSLVEAAVAGSDFIIHLACLSLSESALDPVNAVRVNTEGTLRVLEAARKSGVQRFVFTSTSQVYGGQSPLPNKESDLPHPDSEYAASKLSAEMWCEAYRRMYQLPVLILRLFNVYGLAADRTPRSTVETLFLRQIKQGERPSVYGNPQSGRDFIHIRDALRAIVLALTGPLWEGPLNIGTGVLTTIKEITYMAAQIYEKTINIDTPLSADSTIRLQADTARVQDVLGFQAEIQIQNGLKEVANYL